jgi:hypothetical protein
VPLYHDVKPDTYLGIRLPHQMRERICQLAVLEGNGVSAVTRRLIADGLSREQARKEPMQTEEQER